MKEKNLSKLATPSDLKEKNRAKIAAAVNPLVADAFALYIKSKNFHWHLSGSHFRDYHLLFDEQADQIFAMIDVFAERVRKLGFPTIHSIGEIADLTSVKDDNQVYVEPIQMIERLLKDNQEFLKRLRAAHKVCEAAGDNATTSIIEIYLDETERRIWFLFEIQA